MGMDFLEKAGGLIGGWVQARKNKEAAKEDARKRTEFLNSLDWQPTLASEKVPTYQKSQSPVARAYLESMLTGSNPDLTPDFMQGAADTKAAAQARQNQLYGTIDERVAAQKEAATATPWKVEPPTAEEKSAQTFAPKKTVDDLNGLLKQMGAKIGSTQWIAFMQANKDKPTDELYNDILTKYKTPAELAKAFPTAGIKNPFDKTRVEYFRNDKGADRRRNELLAELDAQRKAADAVGR